MLVRCSSCTLAHAVVIVVGMLMTALLIGISPASAKGGSVATKGDLPIPLYCFGVVGSEADACPGASLGDFSGSRTVMEERAGNTSVLWRVDARGGVAESTSPLR
jgi:hypothetical protein